MLVQTRHRNTTSRGSGFSQETIEAVWRKARIDHLYDSSSYRRDACGALIARASYGDTTPHGWEIDHIVAVANGGSDYLSNLQPLQWENNRFKSDKPASEAYCIVRA
jgi:hypothetical protein